jgi:hypothetical protein
LDKYARIISLGSRTEAVRRMSADALAARPRKPAGKRK